MDLMPGSGGGSAASRSLWTGFDLGLQGVAAIVLGFGLPEQWGMKGWEKTVILDPRLGLDRGVRTS